jgi:uncharacterized surface anchored protein
MRKLTHKAIALLLAVVTLLGMAIPASAASISDGKSTSVTIKMGTRNTYLTLSNGNTLGGEGWTYTTNDGIQGPGFCINWGLKAPSSTKQLQISGRYTASPKTAGAFANGYPQFPLSDFLEVNSDVSELKGLTVDEYVYATQVAVWATLGQLAVEGTAFTAGRATLKKPNGDAQKVRVYTAITIILKNANGWNKVLYTGMYVRADEAQLGGDISLPNTMSLEEASANQTGGIKKETIGGIVYYTREYTAASATSTYFNDYNIDAWAENAPTGTIFTDMSNAPLTTATVEGRTVYKVPTTSKTTNLNANGSEYSGKFKICLPADNVADTGNVTIRIASAVRQFDIYLVNNPTASEQSFIIADPGQKNLFALGSLKWTSDDSPDTGKFTISKIDGTGNPLEGAQFTLEGSDGSTKAGTTDFTGQITWTDLDPSIKYTLKETQAPAGYRIVDAINVTVTAGQTSYVTVTDDTEHQIRIRKLDFQNGAPLNGAVFEFKQINGSFKTTGITGYDGMITFNGKDLPYGSYEVTEIQAPQGYLPDTKPQTVDWNGSADVTLTFRDVRQTGFTLIKTSTRGVSLAGAVFNVYKDGTLITSVEVNTDGMAFVSGLSEGYYEVEEIVAPPGFVLDSTRHGIHIDPYNPATQEDPVLIVTNEAKPSLRILKYDAQTMQPLPNCVFEVYHDAQLIGTYTTDANGEILLSGLAPGTYLVKEVAAPGTHVVNSTPQQIELRADDEETVELIFLNQLKPGIHLVKLDSETMKPMVNAVYVIKKVGGTFQKEFTTDQNGEIDLTALEPGAYTVEEVKAPAGYLIDDRIRTVQINPDENAVFVFTDTKKPSLELVKYDPVNDKYLGVATFRIAKIADGSHYLDRITDTNGKIRIDDLDPGVYSVQEIAAPSGYILNDHEYHVELFPGKTSQIVIENVKNPSLIVWKYDMEEVTKLPGAEFSIAKKGGSVIHEGITDSEGKIRLDNLEEGWYTVTEMAPPPGYLLSNPVSRDVYLEPGKTTEIKFDNLKCPTLTVLKLDSITHDPIKNVRFNVKFSPNVNFTGGVVDLGNYTTDAEGRILLNNNLQAGWYRVTEIEAPAGYIRKEPFTQDIFLAGGDNKVMTFENTPKSALIIHKTDLSGQPIPGATFEVRYLAGTSGSGGTLIKTVVTSSNGTATLTGLSPGTYVVEETIPAPGYQLANPAVQTALITDSEQCVVELHFGDPKMGHLILTKLDSATKLPVAGVTFLVTDSSGAVIGPNNGEFTTDASGVIEITEWLPIDSTINVKEIRCPDNYNMDAPPQSVKIMENTTHRLIFYDSPKSGLQIIKTAADSKQPLKDAHFRVYKANGEVVGDYVTDKDGLIILPTLEPGWYKIVETKAPDGFILDDKPRDVQITNNQFVRVEFENKARSGLLIMKYDLGNKAKTLAGAVFTVTDSEGKVVGTANGRFTTDAKGQILVAGLQPGTYIVTEVAAPSGYKLDSKPQTIKINAGEGLYTLSFYDEALGGLEILKIDEETRTPIPNTEYAISKMNGERISANTYITDAQGLIRIYGLDDGWYTITEVKAAKGYILDPTPHNVEVKNGTATPLRLTNRKQASILLHKVDSVSGRGIYGATFLLSDANRNPIGEYITDQDGYIWLDGTLQDGKYFLREIKPAEGYLNDDEIKTIYITGGKTTEITWKNTPMKGQIVITKLSYDYNAITNLPANSPLAGAVFEVRNLSGNLVETITSDSRGIAATRPLAPGVYVVTETSPPPYYTGSDKELIAQVKHDGDIVRFTVYNKAIALGVTIDKKGNNQVQAGQTMRYDLYNVGNTSSAQLNSFFLHDRIPTDAVRITKLFTGTWNQRLTYSVYFKTNYKDYRVLASGLQSHINYELSLHPNVLGLAAGEYVTDVRWEFGTVNAGFKEVQNPFLYVQVLTGLTNGYQIVNRADVGGKYLNEWQTARTTWLTTLVGNPTPPPTLPKTGY